MAVKKKEYKRLGITLEAEKVVYGHKGLMGDMTYTEKQKHPDDEEYNLTYWGSELFDALAKAEKKLAALAKQKKELEEKMAECDRKIESAKEIAREEVKEEMEAFKEQYKKTIEVKASHDIAKSKKSEDKAMQLARDYKRQNDNLMRIMRERSCQFRGISPTKKRSGYILLKTEKAQYRYTYKEQRTYYRRGNLEYADEYIDKVAYGDCFKSVFETPYVPSMDESEAYAFMIDDWFDDKWGDRRDKEAECRWMKEQSYIEDTEKQTVFAWTLNPDFNKNIWTITLYHTKALEPIKENLKTYNKKKM